MIRFSKQVCVCTVSSHLSRVMEETNEKDIKISDNRSLLCMHSKKEKKKKETETPHEKWYIVTNTSAKKENKIGPLARYAVGKDMFSKEKAQNAIRNSAKSPPSASAADDAPRSQSSCFSWP